MTFAVLQFSIWVFFLLELALEDYAFAVVAVKIRDKVHEEIHARE